MERCLALLLFAVILFNAGVCERCPRGWSVFEDSCYLYIRDNRNWFQAQTICQTLGGYLVEITSQAENDVVTQLSRTHGDQYAHAVWIGLHDFAFEGQHQWVNVGDDYNYTNWAVGQPDDGEGGQDCTILEDRDHYGRWDDKQCSKYFYPYVCEADASPPIEFLYTTAETAHPGNGTHGWQNTANGTDWQDFKNNTHGMDIVG